jgi:hypothetical protein
MDLQTGQLEVVVKQGLVLDAGRWEEVEDNGAITRIVHPPSGYRTLFHQVVAYLDAHSLWNQPLFPPTPYQEALAATAVCLRWGSYLAVLGARNKPCDPRAKDETISHISDGEIRRINVETSAALAEWIDLRRLEPSRYNALIYRALEFLPFARQPISSLPEVPSFLGLASQEIVRRSGVRGMAKPQSTPTADVVLHPSRIFANALVKYAWSDNNGPLGDIQSGPSGGYPLTYRRIGLIDQQRLLQATVHRMLEGVWALVAFQEERGVTWSQQVMPYYYSQGGRVSAGDWALTEATCEVRLPGPESVRVT